MEETVLKTGSTIKYGYKITVFVRKTQIITKNNDFDNEMGVKFSIIFFIPLKFKIRGFYLSMQERFTHTYFWIVQICSIIIKKEGFNL